MYALSLLLATVSIISITNCQNCNRLKFSDELVGTLVPCPWKNAKGMLCMESEPDVVVYPDDSQMAVLKKCGYKLAKHATRNKRDVWENTGEGMEYSRVKRGGMFRISRKKHRGTIYGYQAILKNFVRREWGKEKKEQIDPVARAWIESSAPIAKSKERGEYRYLLGPTHHFQPKGQISRRMRNLFEQAKVKKHWDFLDVDLIMSEISDCTFKTYSGSSSKDVTFNSKDPEGGESSVSLWYYRVGCMQKSGRVFITFAVYSDRITFADINKTVSYWKNNPETLAKFIFETKKWKETAPTETVGSKTNSNCNGGRVFCLSVTTHHKITHMNEFELREVIPQIITENVDNWVKDSKNIFVKRTLTIEQKHALEKWMREAMLSQVFKKFSGMLSD